MALVKPSSQTLPPTGTPTTRRGTVEAYQLDPIYDLVNAIAPVSPSALTINSISEQSSGSGVTVNNLLIRKGVATTKTGAATLTGAEVATGLLVYTGGAATV